MKVTRIGGNAAQVNYRLGQEHGCSDARIDYRTDERERPLRWIGGGLSAVGIEPGAAFASGDERKARALMAGVHPGTGEQLVEAKLAVFEDAKVSLRPLVEAIRAKAQLHGVGVEDLLGSKRSLSAFESAQRAVAKSGRHAMRRADHAGQLADAAGLDPVQVWGSGVFETAVSNLNETTVEFGEDDAPAARIVPRRQRIGNAGYDLSFTLPKSMSLLLAFAEEGAADRIEDLYSNQVGRTFDWIERRTSYQMRGHHGGGESAETVTSNGFLGWSMVHRAARPVDGETVGDPHWHVHVTIANLSQADDGKWATVAAGGRDLMRHAPVADHVLKAMVRHQLATELGVRFERNARTGGWEVAEIPDDTLLAFSRRGVSIREALTLLGVDNQTATAAQQRIVEAESRGDKTATAEASDRTLREHWQARAEATGHDVAGMVARVLSGEPREVDQVEVERIRERLLDDQVGLTSHSRRFSELDAIALVADSLEQGIDSIEDLEQFAQHVITDPRFLRQSQLADKGRDHGMDHEHLAGARLLTTVDVVEAERQIFAHATRSEPGHVLVDVDQAQTAIGVVETGQGFELSAEQRQAVLALTGSARPVETVLGPPGTGKTTLLRAARAAWESAGYRVRGTATAAIAAQNLQVESGIESVTIASLLTEEAPLAGVDVLVIDESSLTDDRTRARLYAEAQSAGTKIVEVGDPQQLRGVGCGSSFGVLHGALQGPELSHNRRQIDADERRTLEAWREGRYAAALESWADRGRLLTLDTSDEAIAAMVDTWRREVSGAPSVHDQINGVLMIAATNDRLERINAVTQGVRLSGGDVADVHTWTVDDGTERSIGVGDLVVMRRNDRAGKLHDGPGVLNGYRAVVTGIDPTAGSISVEWRQDTEDGPELRSAVLSEEYVQAGGVELGYALTAHRAQGLTIGADWIRPDGERQQGTVIADLVAMDNPALYVAASRHKGRFVGIVAADQVLDPVVLDNSDGPTALVERSLVQRAQATADNINDIPVTAAEIHRRDPDDLAEPDQPFQPFDPEPPRDPEPVPAGLVPAADEVGREPVDQLVPPDAPRAEVTELVALEAAAAEEDLAPLREAVAAAHAFYREQAAQADAWVPTYLAERGLGPAAAAAEVGQAPAEWNGLVDHLRGRGFDDDTMLAAGLARRSENGRVYDLLRDRVIVPMRDADGTVVGFAGRINPTSTDERAPKYVNTPGTDLYRKSEILYGLTEHRQEVSDGALPVLVEGPMDALAVTAASGGRQIGLASGGTSFTDQQATRLVDLVGDRPIAAAYDPDTAGRKARAAAWEKLDAHGHHQLTAPALDDGLDPADYVKTGRAAELASVLDRAPAMIDVLVEEQLAAGNDVQRDNPLWRLQVARHLVERNVHRVPAARRAVWLAQVAERCDVDRADLAEHGAQVLLDRGELPEPAPGEPAPGSVAARLAQIQASSRQAIAQANADAAAREAEAAEQERRDRETYERDRDTGPGFDR